MSDRDSDQSVSLRDKRAVWLECMSGEDRNSIFQQLAWMTWNAASFAVVNEAVRLAPPAVEGGVQLNGMMHRLLTRCFFESQSLAVRRLSDRQQPKRARGVYSLFGLLEDMQAHRGLFTREAIFEAEELAYDTGPMKEVEQRYTEEQCAGGNDAWMVPSSIDSDRHDTRHERIDYLAGSAPDIREKCDVIDKKVFEHLKKKVENATKPVKTYVDKFLAHAATPESRASDNPELFRLTLGSIRSAHRALCEVASFTRVYLLGDAELGSLASAPFDQYEYIDRPLVKTSDIDKLKQTWADFETETGKWSGWSLDDYEGEFGSVNGANPSAQASGPDE